jgi:hypothetical protein
LLTTSPVSEAPSDSDCRGSSRDAPPPDQMAVSSSVLIARWGERAVSPPVGHNRIGRGCPVWG